MKSEVDIYITDINGYCDSRGSGAYLSASLAESEIVKGDPGYARRTGKHIITTVEVELPSPDDFAAERIAELRQKKKEMIAQHIAELRQIDEQLANLEALPGVSNE